ncbi:ketopantoate reductase family protein [Salinibacillus kushneri]|nr:2-dehydropantoate 2-reductase [Salinibacillus kushneri]
MKIGIIGLGSIGLLLSACLAREDHQVTCYVRRNQQKERLRTKGVSLYTLHHNRPSSFKVNAKSLGELDEHDLYVVCVKYPQLDEVIQTLRTKAPDNKPILFLQNGMSHVEWVSTLQQPVFIGVLDHGARRKNDHSVEHTGAGVIRIGALVKKDKTLMNHILDVLDTSDFPWIYDENPINLLKQKLVVNAVINPLTAIFDVENGELLTNPYLYHLAKGLCEETCQVLQFPFDKYWDYVKRVAKHTGRNSSSMREDIRNQNQTEIDTISGYVLKQSIRKLPYTSFVYNGIKALENRTGSVSHD